MAKLYLGSIDLNKINKEDIVTKGKDGQPFTNGAKYLNIAVWLNDTPDDRGNQIAIKSGKKDSSYYIGNAKEYVKDQGGAQQSGNAGPSQEADDDLPDFLK